MKRIGLLGGMSWESSIEYYRFINEEVRDRCGGLHSADCLLGSVDFTEIEPLQRTGRWEDAERRQATCRYQGGSVPPGTRLLSNCYRSMRAPAPMLRLAASRFDILGRVRRSCTPPLLMRRLSVALAVLGLAGCGASQGGSSSGGDPATSVAAAVPKARPQVVEPEAGIAAPSINPTDPVGDVNAHAPPLSQIRHELHAELVYAPVNGAAYIDPLQFVNHWERTDQGVDANMPVGAPILAPGRIKILAVEPDWYAGQPLIYWELLDGPQAGQVQYVAEEITDLARPGTILQQGQVIARYAATGTGIEFGWSTPNGTTLAVATTGYEEGAITPAGRYMRAWLNALGANAGPDT